MSRNGPRLDHSRRQEPWKARRTSEPPRRWNAEPGRLSDARSHSMGVKSVRLSSKDAIPTITIKLPLVASNNLCARPLNAKQSSQIRQHIACIIRCCESGVSSHLSQPRRRTRQHPVVGRVEQIVVHLVRVCCGSHTCRQLASCDYPECSLWMSAPILVTHKVPQDSNENYRHSKEQKLSGLCVEQFHGPLRERRLTG